MEFVWWLLLLDDESEVSLIWRVMLEFSNEDQRRALLGLSRDDMIWDVFISMYGSASERSGVEDETRCAFYGEETQSASQKLEAIMPCFETGSSSVTRPACLAAFGTESPASFTDDIAQMYRCSELTTGRRPRLPSRTNVAFRRNSQMVSQIKALANAGPSSRTLVFAFGLAHFEIDSPSVITMLCEQGFGVVHLPTGR